MATAVAPAVQGNLQVGQVLSLAGGTVTGGTGTVTATEQWERMAPGGTWVAIGAGGTSYTLVTADQGASIRVTVTHTHSAVPAHTFAHTSAAVGPVAAAAAAPLAKATDPTLVGNGTVGTVLRAVAGTSTGGTGTVTHAVTLEQGDGPTGPWTVVANPYTVQASDLGGYDFILGATPPHIYRAVDTVTHSAVPANTYTAYSATVGAVKAFAVGTASAGGGPPFFAPVTVAIGTPVTPTVTAATGGVAPRTTTYKWETGPAGGTGPWTVVGTASSYTPVAGDGGQVLHVVVTWADSSVPPQHGQRHGAAGHGAALVAAQGGKQQQGV